MKIDLSIAIAIVIIPCIVLTAYVAIAYALTTTTVDNSNRREYTYCPLSDSDVKSFSGEIDGCPLARVYVNNWSNLTPTQQSIIDTMLRSKGFVDSGENILK